MSHLAHFGVIKPDCVEEARTQKMNDLETEDAKVESSVPTSPFTIRTLLLLYWTEMHKQCTLKKGMVSNFDASEHRQKAQY